MDTREFFSIIEYEVDGPQTQSELVEAFAGIQERWVRFYPGYKSARFVVSTDGLRVYNLVHWASEADYRNFEETSDTEGRMTAIHAALANLSDKAKPCMRGEPRYAVAREVYPGPQKESNEVRLPESDRG